MCKKIIIFVFMLILNPAIVLAEDVAHPAPETISQIVSAFAEKNNVSAAVVVYREGKPQIIYLGESKPTTSYETGSLNEIMIGLLLAQQVDAAKVQLTTPAKQFLPNASDKISKVTLRSLATNTSGLPASAATHSPTSEPLRAVDESWQPSSVGMTTLTKALEAVTHKNIAELYEKQIFSVLGMRSAKASVSGLTLTAEDMQKFLAAAIGLSGTPESILYPMRLTQTAFVILPDRMVGLGWQIYTNEEKSEDADEAISADSVKEVPVRPVFKTDRQYIKASTSTYIAVLPNKKSGIAILLSAPVGEQTLVALGHQLLVELST